MSPARQLLAQRALLHAGGRAGSWGSLGCWDPPVADYASACAALLRRVAAAAQLNAGARVLCVACGAGDELRWLLEHAQAGRVVGVEAEPALLQAARQHLVGLPLELHVGDGAALARLGLPPASFDAVLCVDAAYHLRPRSAFLQQAFELLRPGGRLAYTDLSLAAGRGRSAWLRGAAWLCGLSAQELLSAAAQLQRLQDLGFAEVSLHDLSEPVLGGFVRFVAQQSRQVDPRAWRQGGRRVRWTTRLIAPCRAAGLGYALLSATRPSSDRATA